MDLHTWLDLERGRAVKLAEHLGAKKAAVSLWRQNGVPIEYMPRITEYTAGAVTESDMVAHAIRCREANATQAAA